jgi:hypothetical protein
MATDDCIIGAPAVLNVPPDLDEFGQVVRIVGPLGPIIVIEGPGPSTSVVTSVPVSPVTVLLLAANAARIGATFFNLSTNRFLFLKLGAGATTLDFTVRIGPQSFYEIQTPAYTGIVTGIWNMAGATACLVTELTP